MTKGHKTYIIACKSLNFLKEKETVTYMDEYGVFSNILIEKLEHFVQKNNLQKYMYAIGQTLQDLGYMVIDNEEERNVIDFSQNPSFDHISEELQEKQQEIRQQYIDHEIMYSQTNPVYIDFDEEKKEDYTILEEKTKWDKKVPTYYVNHNNKEILVVNSWTDLFGDRLGKKRNYDGLMNFPEEDQSASAFKVEYDELLWKQIIRYSLGKIGEVNLSIQLKNTEWYEKPFKFEEKYRRLGKLDLLYYENFLHEREVDDDIDFWEQEELSEMY